MTWDRLNYLLVRIYLFSSKKITNKLFSEAYESLPAAGRRFSTVYPQFLAIARN